MRRICNLLALLIMLLPSPWALGFDASTQGVEIRARGTIGLAFTPGHEIDRWIIQIIDAAQIQILVQAFSFTHKGIAQALIRRKQAGVDVQVLSDAEQIERMERSQIPFLSKSGVPVFVDAAHDSAHNKVMIIDAGTSQAVVLAGSFNFTQAAQHRNAENLLVFRDNPELTGLFLANWHQHRLHAQAYEAP